MAFFNSLLGRVFTGRKSRRVNRRGPSWKQTKRLSLESLEGREMMSVNPVSAAGLPYSPVCQIIETFPNGRTQGVSGFMVDKTHVLTAGHAVYNAAFGGWITSATVTPDCQGNGAHPYGQAKEVRAGTFNSWVNWSNAHRDGSSSPDACDIGISVVAIVMWRSTVFATYWGSMGSVCAT